MTKVFSNSRLFIRYMKAALSMTVEKVAQGEELVGQQKPFSG